MRLQHIALLLIGIVFLTGCRLNGTWIDRVEDRDAAESVGRQFYASMNLQRYEFTYTLFSPDVWKVVDSSTLKENMLNVDTKLGGVESAYVESWHTNVVKGTEPKAEYLLQYVVLRKHGSTKEILKLREEKDAIKIYAYSVTSDSL
jgi:hypothetical protein